MKACFQIAECSLSSAKIMKKDKTVVMKGWFLCPLGTKKVSTFWQVDTFL